MAASAAVAVFSVVAGLAASLAADVPASAAIVGLCFAAFTAALLAKRGGRARLLPK